MNFCQIFVNREREKSNDKSLLIRYDFRSSEFLKIVEAVVPHKAIFSFAVFAVFLHFTQIWISKKYDFKFAKISNKIVLVALQNWTEI